MTNVLVSIVNVISKMKLAAVTKTAIIARRIRNRKEDRSRQRKQVNFLLVCSANKTEASF
jgi:hypothetical protein